MRYPYVVDQALFYSIQQDSQSVDESTDSSWRDATVGDRQAFVSWLRSIDHPMVDQLDGFALFQYVVDQLVAANTGLPMRNRAAEAEPILIRQAS